MYIHVRNTQKPDVVIEIKNMATDGSRDQRPTPVKSTVLLLKHPVRL